MQQQTPNIHDDGRSMIATDLDSGVQASVEKGRELLDRGDVSTAVEHYDKAYDADSIDEDEARSMLIEARSHLSRKRLSEALECFEDALIMGTDVQRRQALEGIAEVGAMKRGVRDLTAKLKKGLKKHFGNRKPSSTGLSLIGNGENVMLIADWALERLPGSLTRPGRIDRVPAHVLEMKLPFNPGGCVRYVNDKDISYALSVADFLARPQEEPQAEPEAEPED